MQRFRPDARRRGRLTRPRMLLGGRRRSGPPAAAAMALPAMAVGAACAFFLDPRSGRRRRKLMRDRARGAVRRRTRQIERYAHYESGKMIGLAHALKPRERSAADLDDVGLARK